MREIKFRGKIPGLTDWIYGYYAKSGEDHFILLDIDSEDNYSIVDPETVGQYTGLKDKNGREIYEGDICGCFCNTQLFEVKYCSERCGYFFDDCILSGDCDPAPECLGNLESTIEVIGNIHDNPELLNEKED